MKSKHPMNDKKTVSMLQRIPVILAVTAASYGLQLPPQAARAGAHVASNSRVVSAPTPVLPASDEPRRLT